MKITDEVRVAGKYLVSTLAAEHDFDVPLMHAPAEQVFGDNMTVVRGHFRVPDGGAEMVCNVVAVQADQINIPAEMLHQRGGIGFLVVHRIVKTDGEGLRRTGIVLARKRVRSGSINSAA